MKKRILIIGLVLILMFVMVGCAKKADNQNANNSGDQTMPTIVTTWAGFTNDRSMWKGSLNQDRKLINDQSLPVYRFDSRSDLDKFKSEHQSIYSFDQSFDEVPSFDETSVKYTDSFFSENSILLVYVLSSKDYLRYKVKDMQYENSALLINIVQTDYSDKDYSTEKPVGTAGWFILIEIGKSDYQDCSSYDALTPYLL